jgi:signal transduction histidine kinase
MKLKRRFRFRYAMICTGFALAYLALLLGLNYLISSSTPTHMLREYPVASIMVILFLPISFLAGYLWGQQKDHREAIDRLSQRQEEHVELAESLSGFLKQGEEMRRMIAIAVREMKHPLTSIVGYSMTLREYWDRLDEDSRRDFVAYIGVAASRLEGIANDLMRITELARFTTRAEQQEISIQEIASEVQGVLEEIYRERAVKIGLRVSENPPPMRGDPSRLFDLLYNLLDLCMRCSENDKIVSAWFSFKDDRTQLRLRCPHSILEPEKVRHLEIWPPPESDDELATLCMEYRLSLRLVEDMGGRISLDVMGSNGLSLFVSIPHGQ